MHGIAPFFVQLLPYCHKMNVSKSVKASLWSLMAAPDACEPVNC
jgi:hypothetical protein